jgi:SAM-dependent methyltransferase
MEKDQFVNVKFKDFPSIYYIRKSIYDFLMSQSLVFRGDVLDVGCGRCPYKEIILKFPNTKKYIGLDIDSAIVYDKNIRPDFYWDGKKMPFKNDSFDTVMATEVLEHCPNPLDTLSEIFRVLKKGGHFIFTVPFLFPTHEIPHDEFRYTPFSLIRLLNEAGFSDIKIYARGGWMASLAQIILLSFAYQRAESFMGKVIKKLLYLVSLVLVRFLYAIDKPPSDIFKEGIMTVGFSGISKK